MRFEHELVEGSAASIAEQMDQLGYDGFYVVSHVIEAGDPTTDSPAWHTVIMEKEVMQGQERDDYEHERQERRMRTIERDRRRNR